MAELTKQQRFWKPHVDALASYAGTAAEYARENDLDLKHLYVYKSAIAKREQADDVRPAPFLSAQVPTMSPAVLSVQVLLPNGVRLSLPSLEAPGVLERLAQL